MINRTKEIIKGNIILFFVIIIFSIVLINEQSVRAAVSGDYEYEILDDGTVKITDYFGNDICVEIPAVLDERQVTTIESYAFSYEERIEQVVIPSSITSIGENIFCECCNLENIVVDGKNLQYCSEDGILFNKNKSILIYCPQKASIYNYVIPESVAEIYQEAFAYCENLEEVIIPDGVSHISKGTFTSCINLKKITIPMSVTEIGDYAFSACSDLTQITIPNSVTSIGNDAFIGCEALSDISIPPSVQYIGEWAFTGCCALSEMTIPLGIKDIEMGTFFGCINLKRLGIPITVTSIGDSAFGECLNLILIVNFNSYAERYAKDTGMPYQYYGSSEIIQPERESDSEDITDSEITNPEIVPQPDTVPQPGAVSAAQTVYPSQTVAPIIKNGSNVEISDVSYTVTSTAKKTVTYNCARKKNIIKLSIPATIKIQGKAYKVTQIADNAFKNNKTLKKVKIGENVKTIGKNAFKGCTKLISLTLGKNIVTIGNSAFEGCTAIKKITITSKVSTIGAKTFYNCKRLKTVTIESLKLKKVGSNAFGRIAYNPNLQIKKNISAEQRRKYLKLLKRI